MAWHPGRAGKSVTGWVAGAGLPRVAPARRCHPAAAASPSRAAVPLPNCLSVAGRPSSPTSPKMPSSCAPLVRAACLCSAPAPPLAAAAVRRPGSRGKTPASCAPFAPSSCSRGVPRRPHALQPAAGAHRRGATRAAAGGEGAAGGRRQALDGGGAAWGALSVGRGRGLPSAPALTACAVVFIVQMQGVEEELKLHDGYAAVRVLEAPLCPARPGAAAPAAPLWLPCVAPAAPPSAPAPLDSLNTARRSGGWTCGSTSSPTPQPRPTWSGCAASPRIPSRRVLGAGILQIACWLLRCGFSPACAAAAVCSRGPRAPYSCPLTCLPAFSPCLPQGVGGILAAMVPCLRLYAYLACQAAKAHPFADHEYTGGGGLHVVLRAARLGGFGLEAAGQPSGASQRLRWRLADTPPAAPPPPAEWVRSFSSPEYLRLPARAEGVLDEAGAVQDEGAPLLRWGPALLAACCVVSRRTRVRCCRAGCPAAPCASFFFVGCLVGAGALCGVGPQHRCSAAQCWCF